MGTKRAKYTRQSILCKCVRFFFCFCKFLIELFHSWGKTTAIILDQTIIYSSVRLLSYSGDFHTIWNKKKEEKRTTYSNAKIICHMKHTQVPKLFEYNHEMSRLAETYLAKLLKWLLYRMVTWASSSVYLRFDLARKTTVNLNIIVLGDILQL